MHARVTHEGSFFPGRFPLIGPLFATWRLKKTAARARGGDPDAVRALARQYCKTPNGTVEGLISSVLAGNPAASVSDAFCDEVVRNGDALLASCAIEHRIVPSRDAPRALFLFSTGRISEYLALDSRPGRHLLRDAYHRAPETVKQQVQLAARRNHAQALLADALLGTNGQEAVSSLSGEEWETVVTGLISASRGADLYHLLLTAPVPYALHAVRSLKAAGWAPDVMLRELWEDAAGQLPDRWTYPDPAVHERAAPDGPGARTRSLLFSPDGSVLATAGYDRVVRLWDVKRGDLLFSIHEPGTAGMPVFSPDSACLVTAGRDGVIAIRDAQAGTVLYRTGGISGQDCPLAISPDSSLLAFPYGYGRVRLVRLKDGAFLTDICGQEAPVTSLAFSPDGQALAGGFENGQVCLWPVAGGQLLRRDPGNGDRVNRLQWSAGGEGVLVLYALRHPRFLDAKTGSCLYHCCPSGAVPAVQSVAADRHHLTMAYEDGTVSVFKVPEGRECPCIPVQRGGTACIAPVPGQEMFITGGDDGIIRIFSNACQNPQQMFRAHADRVLSLTVSPNGTAFASAGWDGTVKLWSLPSGHLIRLVPVQSGTIRCLCTSGDGKLLAAGTADGLVRFWHLPNGIFFRTLDAYTGSVTAIALSRDGGLLASAGTDGTVRIWRIADGSLVTVLSDMGGRTYSISFTGDSRGVLAGGWDGNVRLFGIPDGGLRRTFTGHSGVITCIALSPDTSRILSGGSDGTVRIWDATSGNPLATCEADKRSVAAIAVSPDGSLVATGGKDAVIRLFRLSHGDPVAEISGAAAPVTGLAFTPGNDLLLAAAEDGSVAYFSILSRTHIRNFTAHAMRVRGIACAGGGHILATAGDEGDVRIWNLPVSAPLAGMTPDMIATAREEEAVHPSLPARRQWSFLSALLPLRFSHEICLCSPPTAIDEYDIMIVG